MEEAKKMKCYKRLIFKQFVKVSGLCGQQFLSYFPERFMHLCRALYGDAILVHRFGASLVVFSISIPESGTMLSESTGLSSGLFPKGKASCMGTRLSQRRVVYWVTDIPGPKTVAGRSLVLRPVRAIWVTRRGLDRWRHIRNRRGRLGTRLSRPYWYILAGVSFQPRP